MEKEGFTKKKKFSSVKDERPKKVDYKDIEFLRQFVTERGKILPRRITGVSHYYQRMLRNAIKRARYMALLPFVAED